MTEPWNVKKPWLVDVPGNSLQGGIDFLNSLAWNLSFNRSDERWRAWAGDQLLFEADTEAERDAFILGLAIGLAALPPAIIKDIRKFVDETE